VVDRSNSIGRGNVYTQWQIAFSCCGPVHFNRSIDGGASFQNPLNFPPSPRIGTMATGPDGELYITGATQVSLSQLVVMKSLTARDRGAVVTFNPAASVLLGGALIFGGYPNPAGICGQMQVVVDSSSGPTRGHVYALCSVDPLGTDPADVMFSRSSDAGVTWSPAVRVNDVATGWQWFGTISVAPNGRIDVVWNDTRNDPSANRSETFYSFSTDGGLTWAQGVPISPSWNSRVGWPQQNKIGDYYHMTSDRVGANLAYAATFNNEQDVYFLRIGDYDCNGNGVGDRQDIAGGFSQDVNRNGIPDECECVGDLNGDSRVDQADLGILLASFGRDVGGDLDGDGDTDQADLGILLASWNRVCQP
jgi:hypothetical protein